MQYSKDFYYELPGTKSLVLWLKPILDFVNSNLPRYALLKNIDGKVKFIVTELLTNALKHAGETDTSLHITIDHEGILIKRKDHGNRFNPNNLISFDEAAGTKVLLSGDCFHSIFAIIESPYKIRFICQENNDIENHNISELMEHFGLLIVTKSADEFTYQYDHTAGINVFNVFLRFN